MPEIVYLRGNTDEIRVPIHGKTVVQKGECVFLAQDATCLVGAAADRYGYPAANLADCTVTYWGDNLLGISMKGSVSGVTEEIPVAQSGIFRGAIETTAVSQTCKVGQSVAGASVGASGVSSSGVTLSVGTGGDHGKAKIGRVVKYGYAANYVDFMLMTSLSGNSIAALV